MLKVFFVVIMAIIFNSCGVQENKATVITYMAPTYQVNINTASKAELEDMLDGVGPVVASRIIKSRTIKPFESIYDLRDRNIIGKDLFKRIKGDIKVESATNKHS